MSGEGRVPKRARILNLRSGRYVTEAEVEAYCELMLPRRRRLVRRLRRFASSLVRGIGSRWGWIAALVLLVGSGLACGDVCDPELERYSGSWIIVPEPIPADSLEIFLPEPIPADSLAIFLFGTGPAR